MHQERLVIGLMTALVIGFPVLPRAGFLACSGLMVCATTLAFARRWSSAAQMGLFFCLCFAIMATGALSQITFGAAIVAYFLIAKLTRRVPGATNWLRRGQADRVTVALAIGFTVSAAVALLAWYGIVKPDLKDIIATFVPKAPLWILLVGGVFFAMINAAVEEAAYRGVMLQSLCAAFGGGAVSVALQAAAFGTLHIHGFPRGAIGIGLASVYGLMMGVIRIRAKGMLAPWVAHVVTDITIVLILLFLVR